jgi:hypothetical protein
MNPLPIARTGRHRQVHHVVAALCLAVGIVCALAVSAGALTPASHGSHHRTAAVLAAPAPAPGPGFGPRADLHGDVSPGVHTDAAARAAAAPVLRLADPGTGFTDSVRTRGPPRVV